MRRKPKKRLIDILNPNFEPRGDEDDGDTSYWVDDTLELENGEYGDYEIEDSD